MEIFIYVLVILVGMMAGFINTMAGGGSLLTMPMLIFLGLPSAVANGTNRFALLLQNLTAVGKFKKDGFFNYKESVLYAFPAIIGAMIGSTFAINLSDYQFNRILAVVMIFILIIILIKPHERFKHIKSSNKYLGMVLFFGVGIYGGLIQAGVGFIIMASLTLVTSYSLVKINSMKMMIVLIYMIPSFLIFLKSGNVDFFNGVLLAIGNSIGAYLGSHLQVKKGDKIVKYILTVAILISAAKLLGFIKF